MVSKKALKMFSELKEYCLERKKLAKQWELFIKHESALSGKANDDYNHLCDKWFETEEYRELSNY